MNFAEAIEDFQDHAREFFGQIPKVETLEGNGFVKLIEAWGSDRAIVEAARESTNKGFLGWDPGQCPFCEGEGTVNIGNTMDPDACDDTAECPACAGAGTHRGDAKLLRYLYMNRHATPFEMAGAIFQIQAPIFVFREWHRHRTQSYNEMSARYTPLPDLNYVPTVDRLLMSSKKNKQAGRVDGAEALTTEGAEAYREDLSAHYVRDEEFYQHALRLGVPKELARVHLPVGRFSRMRASANLRNWLAFMTLRSAPNAQWEIRQYSNIVGGFLDRTYPRTMDLFREASGP